MPDASTIVAGSVARRFALAIMVGEGRQSDCLEILIGLASNGNMRINLPASRGRTSRPVAPSPTPPLV
jgi:hypothetical protein